MNLIVIFYIDYKIKLPDLRYYNGKDGGLIARFEVTIFMCIIYFLILSRKNKIIFSLYGFIVGLISMTICYLIIGKLTTLNEIFYQLTATLLYVLVFHFIDKYFIRANR